MTTVCIIFVVAASFGAIGYWFAGFLVRDREIQRKRNDEEMNRIAEHGDSMNNSVLSESQIQKAELIYAALAMGDSQDELDELTEKYKRNN